MTTAPSRDQGPPSSGHSVNWTVIILICSIGFIVIILAVIYHRYNIITETLHITREERRRQRNPLPKDIELVERT